MQRYKKDIIQTNNLAKIDKIQRNNSLKVDKIQGNNLHITLRTASRTTII
jgi:hypothetical protein